MSDTSDISAGEPHRDGAGLTGRQQWRENIRHKPARNLVYRVGVGVVGTVVLLVGIVAIPYPGPGWLIVLAGLAILATEFDRAQDALSFVTHRYHAWTRWLGRQTRAVQGLVVLATAAVVLVTLWLLGTVHLVAGWVGWHSSWLASPILG